MLPLFAGVVHGIVFTTAAVTVMVTFEHALVAARVTVFVPVHPFEFLQ